MPKYISEASVAAVTALVVVVGAYFTLRTSLEYDERQIAENKAQITQILHREREDLKILVQIQTTLSHLEEKIDRVLLRRVELE